MSIAENIAAIKREIGEQVQLVAVSKYSTNEEIIEAYEAGVRHFGENKAQDLEAKSQVLPADIKWHFIGHLQRNKVKYIAGYIELIHSVDSPRLLKELNKEGLKADRVIHCLLQVHIADEESKFGLSRKALDEIVGGALLPTLTHVEVVGLMGMATNTEDEAQIKAEFHGLKQIFESLKSAGLPPNTKMEVLSMGMSMDYKIAVAEGTAMVRIGSAVFKN